MTQPTPECSVLKFLLLSLTIQPQITVKTHEVHRQTFAFNPTVCTHLRGLRIHVCTRTREYVQACLSMNPALLSITVQPGKSNPMMLKESPVISTEKS